MLILGQGALRARRRRGGAGVWRGASPRPVGLVQRRLERLQRAAHARRRGSAGSISASCRGRAAATSRGILDRRRTRARSRSSICSAPTRSTRTQLGKAFVDLSGPSRRCRRASRRCRPAGRRLYREERHLRQHRGPRAADGRCAVFPPGEAREDWTILRALVRRARQARCPYDSLGQLRRRLFEISPRFAASGRRRAGGVGRVRHGRADRRRRRSRRRSRIST